VNIEAIVTLAPGELNATGSQYIVGDAAGGPWSGIFIFEGSGGNLLFRGDRVRISGTVGEFSGTTQLLPQRADAVEFVDFGNPEPPVYAQTTTVLDTTEAWENVLVRTFATTVIDTTNNVFAFLRAADGHPPVLVVANFTPVPRYDYRVGVPVDGDWAPILESDATEFGGSGVVAGPVTADPVGAHGQEFSVSLTAGPLAISFFVPIGHNGSNTT